MSKLQRARDAARRQREKARQERREMMRRAWSAGGAYLLGSMERSGAIESVPQLWGLPRTVTLAALGIIGGQYASGMLGDALDGVGDAALAVAAYQLGSTGAVRGVEGLLPSEVAGDPLLMADALADAEETIGAYEDALDEVLEAAEADLEGAEV